MDKNSTRGTRGNRRVDSLGAQTAHFDLLDWCTPNESTRDKTPMRTAKQGGRLSYIYRKYLAVN